MERSQNTIMNISVLGCGWLGLPLAQELIRLGHSVKGSVTGRDKLQLLSEKGIIPFQIKILEEGVQGDLSSFLLDTELLIINIPPELRSNPEANYIGKIGRLQEYLQRSSVENVIFVSATSVYEDTEEIPVYTENDPSNGTAENASQLRASEAILQSNQSYSTTVLRYGGLYGPGRHPVTFLAGRKNIKNPKARVNLIHLEDCIGIITSIISQEAWGDIIHGVYPEHPLKEMYYTRLAEMRNLEAPQFEQNSISNGKVIESIYVGEKLEYSFQKDLWD